MNSLRCYLPIVFLMAIIHYLTKELTSQLKGGSACFGSECEGRPGGGAGASGHTHVVHNEEAEEDEHCCSPCFLFCVHNGGLFFFEKGP